MDDRRLTTSVRRDSPTASAGGGGPWIAAVLGGAPRLGCTSLAVHLAAELADGGSRVVYADLDSGGRPWRGAVSSGRGWGDVLRGECDVHEALLRGTGGVQILPGVRRGQGTTEADYDAPDLGGLLRRRFAPLARYVDVVVVDLGSGHRPAARRLARGADALALVSSDDPSIRMQSYGILKLVQRGGPPPRTLVAWRESEASPAGRDPFAECCRKFLGFDVVQASLPEVAGEADDGDVLEHPAPLPSSAGLAEKLMQIGERPMGVSA